jgi:hypothetical protein
MHKGRRLKAVAAATALRALFALFFDGGPRLMRICGAPPQTSTMKAASLLFKSSANPHQLHPPGIFITSALSIIDLVCEP